MLARGGLAVALLLAAALGLSAQGTTREKYALRQQQRSAFNLSAESDFAYNVNNWLCGLNNRGEICTNTFGSTTGGGGFWPAGTGNQYVFQAGLQFAARDPLNPNNFNAAFCFNVGASNASCKALGSIYHSDNAEDLANWPDACYLYNPQTGERVQTLSQLDTCVRYWDGDPAATVSGGHPMGVEVTQHTLAFTLSGFRDMIFYVLKLKNVSNAQAFRDANRTLAVPAGGWTLNDMYVAFGADMDVSADEATENYGTFVPYLRPGQPLFLATIWQSDFVAGDFVPYPQCGFCSNPGFVGTTFLRSPYNNTGDTIRTNTAGVTRVVPPIAQKDLEPLRLAAAKGDTVAQRKLLQYEIGQSFGSLTTNGGTFPDAANAAQAWRYYSGRLNAQEAANVTTSPPGFGFVDQPTHADTRYFHATGPFTLAPGDSTEVIVGLVAGAPVLGITGFSPAQGNDIVHGLPGDTARPIEKIMGRGREGTAYPSLFKAAVDARTLFATNFLLPSPPPAPTVTVIPGNHETKVVWSDEAVGTKDPYFPIAQQRGISGFRESDFEGYRVYRKVRPNGDWERIAQYDLKDGLTEVVTPVDTVVNQEGQVVVVKADTARAGGDTGLRFSLIDRGGSFPDPSTGPGLINGVTYYYAVTAYDINTPFAPGGSSLESGQRLSAAAQAVGGAGGTPRADAPNLTAGSFATTVTGSDNTVLNTTAADPTIDAETGKFSAAMPPTNGFSVAVEPFIPEIVTAGGTATLTIDSIVPGNPLVGQNPVYYLTAQTPAGTQHKTIEVPVGFTDEAAAPTALGFDLVKADQTFASRFGVSAAPVKLSVEASLASPGNYFLAGKGRGWINGAAANGVNLSIFNGPRWFVSGQGEPADPNGGTKAVACANGDCTGIPGGLLAGDIPGYRIYPVIGYLTVPSGARDMEAVWSTVTRAADIEVTWGANGKPTSVIDLTHHVAVPFSTDFRSSWGFLTPASFAGVNAANTPDRDNAVITSSDWTCVAPQNQFAIEENVEFAEYCTDPAGAKLQDAAVITPIDSTWAGGSATGRGRGAAAGRKPGFAMFINGRGYFFFGTQLPAAGAKWTLRTYSGAINAAANDANTDVAGYVYGADVRPPAVPGLKVTVALTPSGIDETKRDVANVHTVPDPFVVSNAFQTNTASRHIQFVNLPDKATIRIYSLSGVLVTALQHDDPTGGGTENWDLRNRNSQFVASGVYFYYVNTPDGKSKVGKFTIIQAPSQTSVPTTN
ncbi:MAG TPA: T9SS type A sorting domain-containing protein [Longimicrobiales bacterium]|nr:T9SS type A sorting domain-containing protein [Longimicrobiales bacterium]